VVYASSSSALATGSTLTFDGSGLGLGITPAANTRLTMRTAASTDTLLVADNGVNTGFKVQFASALTSIGNDFNQPLAFLSNNAEQMRLTTTGLGIGTTSVDQKLVVQGGAGAAGMKITDGTYTNFIATITTSGNYGNGNSAGQLFFRSAYGIAFSTTNGGSTEMTLNGSGNLSNTGNIDSGTGKNISLNADDSGQTTRLQWKYSGTAQAWVERVNANGAMAFGVQSSERMRIDSSGNLLVGTTSNPATSRLAITVDTGVSGNCITTQPSTNSSYNAVLFKNSAATDVGSIGVTNSATSYNTSSDYRLKNTIVPMTNALAKVAQLKPITYKWNVDGSDCEGFIAHELAEVCPLAVSGEKDAVDKDGNPKYQGIDTSFLVATLTAAIQELDAKFEAYKASHP
jgi:hypothetical protein